MGEGEEVERVAVEAVPAGPLLLIKLGGSLISDKTKPETLRQDVLDRIARYQQSSYSLYQ